MWHSNRTGHRSPVTGHLPADATEPAITCPMADAKKSALVLFAHGARDAQWSEPFRAMQAAVAGKRPDLSVELAFLEIMQPSLAECVTRLARDGHERIV